MYIFRYIHTSQSDYSLSTKSRESYRCSDKGKVNAAVHAGFRRNFILCLFSGEVVFGALTHGVLHRRRDLFMCVGERVYACVCVCVCVRPNINTNTCTHTHIVTKIEYRSYIHTSMD